MSKFYLHGIRSVGPGGATHSSTSTYTGICLVGNAIIIRCMLSGIRFIPCGSSSPIRFSDGSVCAELNSVRSELIQ